MLKDNAPTVEKYRKIANQLESKEGCTVKSTLFISPSYKSKEKIKNIININNIKETDFSNNRNAFVEWVNSNGGDFKQKDLGCPSDTEFVLSSICRFAQTWPTSAGSDPVMKLYNSFNYTQDVKYEARLLELPLRSEFKLVVLVPNEADVLHTLFCTLAERGLAAAVNSIQPLFTATSELKAPSIEINSTVMVEENISGLCNASTMQYGTIEVNEQGAYVSVLTCITSPATVSTIDDGSPAEPPFHFAVVFNDRPLFIGQFIQR